MLTKKETTELKRLDRKVRGYKATRREILRAFDLQRQKRHRPAKTELTECGEQHVMPGCERQVTRAAPQGGLWD